MWLRRENMTFFQTIGSDFSHDWQQISHPERTFSQLGKSINSQIIQPLTRTVDKIGNMFSAGGKAISHGNIGGGLVDIGSGVATGALGALRTITPPSWSSPEMAQFRKHDLLNQGVLGSIGLGKFAYQIGTNFAGGDSGEAEEAVSAAGKLLEDGHKFEVLDDVVKGVNPDDIEDLKKLHKFASTKLDDGDHFKNIAKNINPENVKDLKNFHRAFKTQVTEFYSTDFSPLRNVPTKDVEDLRDSTAWKHASEDNKMTAKLWHRKNLRPETLEKVDRAELRIHIRSPLGAKEDAMKATPRDLAADAKKAAKWQRKMFGDRLPDQKTFSDKIRNVTKMAKHLLHKT